MASKDTKVKSLIIELSGKDVELTLAQAKELQAALNELFEEKIVERTKFVPQPYPVPEPYPVYPRPWRPYYERPWITWGGESPLWKTSSGTSLCLDSNAIRMQLKS